MRIEVNTLNPAQFKRLYESVEWVSPDIRQIKIALGKSLATFSVFVDDRLVGMARLLGDGAMSFYIRDLVIHPEYQGQDLGKQLVEYMEEYILKQIEESWMVSLELICPKSNIGFYSKLGFEESSVALDSSMMLKMIRK